MIVSVALQSGYAYFSLNYHDFFKMLSLFIFYCGTTTSKNSLESIKLCLSSVGTLLLYLVHGCLFVL